MGQCRPRELIPCSSGTHGEAISCKLAQTCAADASACPGGPQIIFRLSKGLAVDLRTGQSGSNRS